MLTGKKSAIFHLINVWFEKVRGRKSFAGTQNALHNTCHNLQNNIYNITRRKAMKAIKKQNESDKGKCAVV